MHAIGLKFRLQLNIYLFNTAADTIYSLFNYNFAVCVFLHPFLITKNVNQVLNEMQWIKKFTFKRDRNKRLITNICAKLCFLSRLSARICLFVIRTLGILFGHSLLKRARCWTFRCTFWMVLQVVLNRTRWERQRDVCECIDHVF